MSRTKIIITVLIATLCSIFLLRRKKNGVIDRLEDFLGVENSTINRNF